MNKIQELLSQKKYLLADGAMGTNLFKRGLISGDEPALWNIHQSERIKSVHQEFIDAGCDIILTNSFGANKFRLKLHKSEHLVADACHSAVNIVKECAETAERPIIIAGDIGPSGELITPNGALSRDEAIAGFSEQAMALKDAGADCIWIETMSAIEEVECAYIAALKTGLPIVCTMTFDTNGRTMMGITPESATEFCLELAKNNGTALTAMGINCGKSPAESVYSLYQEQQALQSHLGDCPILVAKANCGVPVYKEGGFIWSGNEESMAEYAKCAYQLGARIIGGCCGTDGVILSAIKRALDNYELTDTAITPEYIKQVLGEIPHLNNKSSGRTRGHRH